MLNCYFEDKEMLKGIDKLLKYKKISFDKEINGIKSDIDGYLIDNKEDRAIIYYNEKGDFYAALGTLIATNRIGQIASSRDFKCLGIMLDCARNAVPNVEGLKREIVTLVLAGYNNIGLYLEDCLEVDNEPYFGYMRGRFTQKEIREVVEFAEDFGVEIMPYIQTLAHLARLFCHWRYALTIKDIRDILLMDEPRTYELLENVISSVSKCFKTKRINIGMDEAFLMTQGKYKEIHGQVNTVEVFARHIGRVCEICNKYGLKPEAWADMYTKYVNEIKIPDNLSLVYWNYYSMDQKVYREGIKKVQQITDKVVCAGGAWKWVGYAPLNEFSNYNTIPFVKEAKKNNVESFIMTAWGDDGAECSYNAILGSLIFTSNLTFEKLSKSDLSKKAKLLTGYTIPELYALDLPNKTFDGKFDAVINPAKYALYEDSFYGIVDLDIGSRVIPYYEKSYKILKRLAKRNSEYNYIFENLANLCNVLRLKADLRNKIRAAYDAKDKNSILKIAEKEMPIIIKRAKVFYESLQYQWLKENKAIGLEVLQIRVSGVIARLEYVKKTLSMWAQGKLEVIQELEEKDLSEIHDPNIHNGQSCYAGYGVNVTYCDFSSLFM